MKNKKLLLSLVALLSCASASHAQLSGPDAYMKGNYIEIGVSGIGGFEGADSITIPAGMNYRSNQPYFGFVANPQMDSWTNYDGDFFTPGSPENGWGFEIGTTGTTSGGDLAANNCSILNQIPGAITSWSYTAGQILCDWEGDATSGADLHFKINYQLQDNDLFYITTVTVTNNTTSTIPEMYYYRNLDPDNNIMLSGDYTTQNTIVSQASSSSYAQVSATQALPWSSYFAFVTQTADTNWRASYGGFSNRDPSDEWNGIGFTQTVGATNFADEAITISYRIQNLAPNDSATFKFCSVFDGAAVTSALTGMETSYSSINNTTMSNVVSVFPNPFTDVTTIKIGKDVKLINAEIHFYDIAGKEVKVLSVSSTEIQIDRKGLADGMYFYKLINKGEAISTGKLTIK
ncbi:hypothetical protein BH10BAC1_BH10BAC1_05790 [soil metagenome]